MEKNMICKSLVLVTIILFIGVCAYPAFAVEIKSTLDVKENKDDCGCQVISKFQFNKLERLLNKFEFYSRERINFHKPRIAPF